jgi:hypothetical protein
MSKLSRLTTTQSSTVSYGSYPASLIDSQAKYIMLGINEVRVRLHCDPGLLIMEAWHVF